MLCNIWHCQVSTTPILVWLPFSQCHILHQQCGMHTFFTVLVQKSHALPWPNISEVAISFLILWLELISRWSQTCTSPFYSSLKDYSGLKRQHYCEDFWFETGEKLRWTPTHRLHVNTLLRHIRTSSSAKHSCTKGKNYIILLIGVFTELFYRA